MNTKSLDNRNGFSRILIRLIMVIHSFAVLYPMFWLISCSLKTNKEFFSNMYGLPAVPQFVNFMNAWEKAKIGKYFINTFVITVISVILIVLLSSTTAYCLSRIDFRFKKIISAFYMAGLIVPTMAGIIPLFILLKRLSLYNSTFSLIMLYGVYALPFSILLLSGFFKTIPSELEEASIIDGCSYYRLFWKVMLPLAMPGIITLCIFQVLYVWNEFTFAYVFLNSEEKRTLQIGLANLHQVQMQRADWATMFAAIVIVMLPTLIMYIAFQRRIQEGITLGTIK